MKDSFLKNIKELNLFSKKDKLILAISGGADSVALARLLHENGFNFVFAHCNFNLRGRESDQDELFVKNLSKKLDIQFFSKSFNTENYSKENKISVQMAARELRYSWFEELRLEIQAQYILVAHHRDDDLETFFINLTRGTGIKGLLGIKPVVGKVVRPLLIYSRTQIEDYLSNLNQEFRTDSTNSSEKYLRNNIRHNLIPLIKEMNPSFENTLKNEMIFLNDVYTVFRETIENIKDDVVIVSEDVFEINKSKLLSLKNNKIFLRELIHPFGFSQSHKILESCNSSSGKIFHSNSHRLLIDRDKIIISKKHKKDNMVIELDEDVENITYPISLKFRQTTQIKYNITKNTVFLDKDKLTFPLKLRKWEEGDFFYPLGMNGRKKLSDFFIDNKFNRFEKEECYILCSGSDIVWIVGHRIDDRFKVSDNTKKVYIAELFN